MAIPVLVLGPSGSGKTYSLRNLPNDSYGLIECEKTMLPFKGVKKFARTKDFNALSSIVTKYAEKYPIVVVDDFGYCITDIYMRGSWGDDKYRDQFEVYKEIAGRVYRFIEFVNDLPGDVIVYLMMHTDVDAQGNIVLQRFYRLDDQWDQGNGIALIEFHNDDTDTWAPGPYTVERRCVVNPVWDGTPPEGKCEDALRAGVQMIEGDIVRTVYQGSLTIEDIHGEV